MSTIRIRTKIQGETLVLPELKLLIGKTVDIKVTEHSADSADSDGVVHFVSDPRLSPDVARRLLDEMAALGSGRALPVDWSRADLYEDHD